MCAVGAYATQRTSFMVVLMIVFGVVGYIFKKSGIPAGAFLVAYMLGATFESNLQRTMIILDNKLWLIFTKPIADAFLIVAILCLVYVVRMQKQKKQKREAASNDE